MASFYQRVTGRRQIIIANPHEDAANWLPFKTEGSSHQRWGSEPRNEPVAIASVRSRSRTMNSTISFYAASNSDSSNCSSRAVSPHLTRDKHIAALDRRENPAKMLLSKSSRILRSHSSKFSLSSLHTMDSDTSERYSSGRPVTAHTAKDRHNPVEAVKREELKRTISEPYDFQHVTHTDRVFLKSMERVSKTELVGEFSALRFGQASKPQLRGIRAEALPSQKQIETTPTSPVTNLEMNINSSIPQMPRRPTSPLKDETEPLSPARCIRISRSVDSFSRPSTSPSISQVTPPRRYSSRRALQPSLNSHLRSLGAYVHSPSHSVDACGAASIEDGCVNCKDINFMENKPLPGLLPIHALTTNDDSARYLHSVPLPRALVDLADVPEEEESKRQSTIELQPTHPTKRSAPIDNTSNVTRKAASTSTAQDDMGNSMCNRTFVVDDWDDAIDDSWDYAAEPDAMASQCPSSMSAQVATFVDKAMTKLAGPQQNAASASQEAEPTLANPPSPQLMQSPNHCNELRLSTCNSSPPKYSESSPLLGLGIGLHQACPEGLDPCATTTPAIVTVASKLKDRGSSLTDSFNSDFSAASGTSKCSSQESIIWSIASSIIGTQRSSNSSNGLLEQSPDYLRAVKPTDNLKEALESVQGHLQEIHEEQLTPDYSSDQLYSPGKHSHQHTRSLATNFVFGAAPTEEQRQRPTSRSGNSPRASHGHERVLSGSRIPIPARKSSAREQPELSRPAARHMRSATTISRSRHVSRASYSLFPGSPSIHA